MSNGYVIYRGPSMLDRQPIVAIATGYKIRSANAKTGDMIQTWIFRDDVAPLLAAQTGADASVCGDCRHRNRSCYVMLGMGPANIWLKFWAGGYPARGRFELAALGRGRQIRLGAYGDPAAVPIDIWHAFVSEADYWTGYTHQWRRFPDLKRLCMASVDTVDERSEANRAGWRTFRVRRRDEPVGTYEIACPASAEAGKKTTCNDCRACGGLSSKARVDIAIVVHGDKGKQSRFERNV